MKAQHFLVKALKPQKEDKGSNALK